MPRPKLYKETASIHTHLEKVDKEAFAKWCAENQTTMADEIRKYIYSKTRGCDRA
jgi:hypothetical protein